MANSKSKWQSGAARLLAASLILGIDCPAVRADASDGGGEVDGGVSADAYDAALVDGHAVADVGEYEPAPPSSAYQLALVEAYLNDRLADEAIYVLRGEDAALYVKDIDLRRWRLIAPDSESVVFEGDRYTKLVPASEFKFEFADQIQRLSIRAGADRFTMSQLQVAGYDPGPMTPAPTGAFLNYDISGDFGDHELSGGVFIETGLFSGNGVGINRGVLRHDRGGTDVIRLDTNWTIDDPASMRSLRIGDTISRGSAGSHPFRLAGVQWGTNFAVRPGFVTMPLLTVEGSAALPSTAEIYVNGVLRATEPVAAGSFQIRDLPVLTGQGNVQLVVRDALGRDSVATFRYYASQELLRRGLHDYSYETGFIRRSFGSESFSYGDFVAVGTHRYGFTDRLTGEGHTEASKERQLLSASATALFPWFGVVTISGAASRSRDGNGSAVTFAFDRYTPLVTLSGSVELTTRDFGGVYLDRDVREPATTIRGAATKSIGRASFSATYFSRSGNGFPKEQLIGLNSYVNLPKIGFLSLSAYRAKGNGNHNRAELKLTIPLGNRMIASAGVRGNDGGTSGDLSVQQNVPYGEGFGYQANATFGENERLDARIQYHSATQNYQFGIARAQGQTDLRAGVSGSLAVIGDNVFVGRELRDSFGFVHTGFPNVRVYADNHLVGRTNDSGVAVIPYLRSFDRNVIRIEPGDLPLDVEVDQIEQAVRPYARSGVQVVYGLKSANGALVDIVLEDGSPPPAGASIHVSDVEEEFVAAPDGQAYLNGLKPRNLISVQWEGGRCTFNLDFKRSKDPQPHLGRHICRGTAR